MGSGDISGDSNGSQGSALQFGDVDTPRQAWDPMGSKYRGMV